MNTLRGYFLLACIACAVCTAPAHVHAENLELVIKTTAVEIDSGMVSLSDVAEIKSPVDSTAKRIGELDLDEIKVGQTIEITKKQIRMRVRLMHSSFDSIAIRGPDRIVVKRVPPGNKFAAAKSQIKDAIVSQFGIPQEDVRVDLNEASLAKSGWGYKEIENSVVVLPTELPLGKTKVRFVRGDDTGAEIDCQINVLTEMLVANRNLGRGVELTHEDYKVVKRPMNDRRLIPASKMDTVGRETTTVIPVHGIIRLSDLTPVAKRNLVKRNDVVDIVFARGPLKLRVKNAKVLTAGSKGDRVEVLNPTSQRRLVASVVSESLVEIR